jgi:hypothetical protein
MPKPNTIYTVTTLKTVYGYKNPVHTYELGCRCVGFFMELEDAQKEVENNSMDIYEEGYYPFVVIEAVYEGIYGITAKEWWYQWIDNGYKPIDKPKSLKNTVAFGIG